MFDRLNDVLLAATVWSWAPGYPAYTTAEQRYASKALFRQGFMMIRSSTLYSHQGGGGGGLAGVGRPPSFSTRAQNF